MSETAEVAGETATTLVDDLQSLPQHSHILGLTDLESNTALQAEFAPDKLPEDLAEFGGRVLELLQQRVAGQLTPETVRQFLGYFHGLDYNTQFFIERFNDQGDVHFDGVLRPERTRRVVDKAIDHILGIDVFGLERKLYEKEQLKYAAGTSTYGDERTWFTPTPERSDIWSNYAWVREALEGLGVNSDDTVYDLGSGYGRVLAYTAMVTGAACKGIELVPERVRMARRMTSHLALQNVDFEVSNVVDADYSDGTVFYMYFPFSDETRDRVFYQLRKIANDKQIFIAYQGIGQMSYDPYWLTRLPTTELSGFLNLWISKE